MIVIAYRLHGEVNREALKRHAGFVTKFLEPPRDYISGSILHTDSLMAGRLPKLVAFDLE